MSYEEARDIFDSKAYVDAPMRGELPLTPLKSWVWYRWSMTEGCTKIVSE